MEKFVLHWGEMGSRWGVNRSVAQIHALLYLSARPLPAEEIADALSIARSNVSNSLKELQAYQLIDVVHLLGDRRDHFKAETDPWNIMLRIAEERKRREIDPALTMLRDCVKEADGNAGTDPVVRERLATMLEFLDGLTGWYDQVKRLPRAALTGIMKLGGKITALIRH
ncbi:GbsR/MarR family transcriptional regulator [Lichenifustis flavocetrariae]|uniref:HTH-type transcriptional regulator n=1 Tax=Lichenifustis flavocetrariae TaxID=2949735 RepID=A0AA42CKX9_9HYPH|nr:MarR family transcriptional regulator [Lichenifustis flavocetrariae]MCW6511013.1 MarR family transcriptional regulator [Lichenifustis flavocetrariae]